MELDENISTQPENVGENPGCFQEPGTSASGEENPGCSQEPGTSASGEENPNSFQEEVSLGLTDEESVDMEASSKSVDEAKARIEREIAELASKRAPELSDLERGLEAAGSSEFRRLASRSSSVVSDTECEEAAKRTRTVSYICREDVYCCRELKTFVLESMEIIRKHVLEFEEKSRNEPDPNGTYAALARKYGSVVRSLRRKATRLEAVADSAEGTAIIADRNTNYANEAIIPEEIRRARFAVCQSEIRVNAARLIANREEISALTAVKKIWADIRADENVDIRSVADSDEYNRTHQCENRSRKTRVANFVGFCIGVMLVAATVTLFKPWSDAFDALLSLAVVILGWTVIYWAVQFWRMAMKCRRRRTRVAPVRMRVPSSFLTGSDARAGYLLSELERNGISPAPSDSEPESED